MMEKPLQPVDHAALKTNQVAMIALIFLAFILNSAWLIALLVIVLAIGVVRRRPGFDFVYKGLLKPRGWVKPDVLLDHPEPHRFSQLIGTVFLAGSAVALFASASILGWGLAWMVAGLAALNAFGGFCLGCAIYYWLGRMHVPGFYQRPPEGTFPGRKPKTSLTPESQPAQGG